MIRYQKQKLTLFLRSWQQQGFTPSVFSLDLPTKGDTDEEREAYKRALNHQINQFNDY